jgi:hypothetical protein
MPAATAYVLHVPEGRRDIILNYAEENRHDATRYVAEPVPSFSYGSNALVVLACFRDGAITHIANGRKGMSAGTGLARLNITELQRLERPLPFEEFVGLVPAKFRAPFVASSVTADCCRRKHSQPWWTHWRHTIPAWRRGWRGFRRTAPGPSGV